MKVLGASWKVALIFYVATISYVAGESCGDGKNCTCSNSIMDCRMQHFKTFPQDVRAEIEAIYLTNNDLSSLSQIPEEAELKTLVLSNNSILKLEYDTFDNLDNLKTLHLSNNSIKTIEDDIFEWNPLKLEVLHLDGNKLQFIQHFLFYDLDELTDLYLQNNEIVFIHPHAFLQLKNLRNLRLDGNQLHTFNHKWIEKLQANSFSTLRFDGNPWSCDCAMNHSQPWLQKKKSSGWFHQLTETYPIVCKKPAELDGHLLSSVDNTTLMKNCQAPRITGISAPAKVDEGRDLLLRCVTDQTLLPNATISWTAPNKDVYRLNTANNFDGIEVNVHGDLLIRNLSHIDNGSYTCTATNVKGTFTATTTVEVLKKKAGETPSTGKPVHGSVETPDDGKSAIIHKNCPKGCQCISRHIDCAGDGRSPMSSIPEDMPSDAITINLASNGLTELKADDFTKFKNLEELRLDNNQISKIHPRAFSTLTGLMTLTLQENNLKEITPGTFDELESLNVLVLDKNKLTSLSKGIFDGLVELQWLYVRHNFIQVIGDDVFTPLKKIKFIHMESNKIGVIYRDSIDSLINMQPSTIRKIFVDNNPFMCNCNMEDLRNALQKKEIHEDFFGDGIICNSPPDFAEKRLKDIKQTLPCDKKDAVAGEPDPYDGRDAMAQPSGNYSGLLFGGIAVGVVLTIVITILWRKYGRGVRTPGRSYNYSNLNGSDESERRGLTDNLGNSGTEAFV